MRESTPFSFLSSRTHIARFHSRTVSSLPPYAPSSSQVFRLVPLAYLLFLSYAARVPPSSAGRWYLASHPFLDLCSNLLFPVGVAHGHAHGQLARSHGAPLWFIR